MTMKARLNAREIYSKIEIEEVGIGVGPGPGNGVVVVAVVVVVDAVVVVVLWHSQIGQFIKWWSSLLQPSRWHGMLQFVVFVWRYK